MEEPTNNPTPNNQAVEVISITAEGCWLRVFSKEYFRRKRLGNVPKDYYLSFERYPHFLGVAEEEIRNVSIVYDFLRWKTLDIDLSIDNFEHPKRRTSLGFTKEQLERLKQYNDEQEAKGGKPWLSDRLLDFDYWRKINNLSTK